MTSTLKIELAHQLARVYHEGQKDKAGIDYIKHPEFVADHVTTDEEKIVAYLHDTVEDTNLKPDIIKELFGEDILKSVLMLTHNKDEDYLEYVKRVKKDKVARAVKIADLTHNMQIDRIPNPSEKDYKRLEKYKKAIEILKS